MEENASTTVLDGEIIGIRFGLATRHEICTASISDCPIGHATQLGNPFLGLPLEFGKCESCGTAEPGKCEGHFGYIELPIPVYHPSHVLELKRMLSLLCLKCLKIKTSKIKNNGISERLLSSCCEDASQVSIKEAKTGEGAYYLELKLPSRSRVRDGFWNFLERYGYRYGDSFSRTLLPSEVMEMLKRIPEDTRRKLAGKGYFPQDGYILQFLPVPPNCLSVPDVSDGVSIMSSDQSVAMLKKVLKEVESIKSSRSGTPNFESHEVEANELQSLVEKYLEVRGTAKASRDMDKRFGISKEPNDSSTKAWLEKIRTLFIRKGSGFSSRSVITGDAYKGVNEIGLPFEIAQRITFEERVNVHNMKYLQELVDNKLCLTYRDGLSTYSLREGSKGHTFLRPGQVVHRRIMDGDIVFINRPPTTHKHSLQALSVYVHDDHTVKINPLICGPLSADFDGDCVHLFYPQSLAAKAEVLELFSVEKQLLSSHNGSLNLQLANDSLLSLKVMLKKYFLDRAAVQQLAMFVSTSLPPPALLKAHSSGPLWTALQILQTALPAYFDCYGESHLIVKSDILKVDFNTDIMQSMINEIVTSVFFEKGPEEVLKFFNFLQPLLMENLFAVGFSVGLEDFFIPMAVVQNIQEDIQDISPLLYHLSSTYNELVELQVENHLRHGKVPVANFILKSSALGSLIDSKSDSAINKVVQQIGFLGPQLSDKGKFYSRMLVEDMASHFQSKYPFGDDYPSLKYGLIKSCFFHGLDPYEEMVHSISSREVIVRSSRGLSEPGTLFKNLMAILRDVVICYDGTVRNVCSNSIIQFQYGVKAGAKSQSLFPAGEPVGVLAATAMSNPAYKAVLDSSPSSNSSWELMKEILLCRSNFTNDPIDRRVTLYLNDCDCGRKYCRENAAYLVMNQLKKVSLKDAAVEFMIEYKKQRFAAESSETDAGLAGHVHLNKDLLKKLNISMHEILQKCQETINSFRKKKKVGHLFKRLILSVSECCSFQQSCGSKWCDMPCLMFFWQDTNDVHLESTSNILADMICPVLLQTIIKGDPRICTVNIIWISPDTTTWIRNPCQTQKGELALDIVLEKTVVRQSGDAWRIVMDSCLPIIHLIDTGRSIPYAIKQIQELLGVSCAFDQAVQRLSKSVTMVAKGVLKEHLILLANSMTCAGNLVGFNSGGIKSLSRSLNVQVPFTEATLFTPRKCFERAAEKCHIDSLSSIVASCSWGKQVAVGTGSRFEILWDTKEVGLNREAGIDVYNFLHLVRSGSNGEVSNTACLGADIDDLMLDDENMELGMSPEHDSDFVKPVFEDSAEFQYSVENQMLDNGKPNESTWDKVSSINIKSNGGGDWVVDKGNTTSMSKPDAWSSWGTDKVKTQDVQSSKAKDDFHKSAGWNETELQKGPTESEPLTSWGKKANSESEPSAWGKKATSELEPSAWGKATSESEPSAWGKKVTSESEPSAWGKKVETLHKAGWNRNDEQPQMAQARGSFRRDDKVTQDESRTRGWASTVEPKPSTTWGNTVEAPHKAGWNGNDGQPLPDQARGSCGWGDKVTHDESTTRGWASSTTRDRTKDEPQTRVVQHGRSPVNKSSWDSKVADEQVSPSTSLGWGPSTDNDWNKVEPPCQMGQQKEFPVKSWGSNNNVTKEKANHLASSQGWDSPKAGGWNESAGQSQWGEQRASVVKKDPSDIELNQPATSPGWDSPKAGGLNDSESQWGKKDHNETLHGWGTTNDLNQLASSHGWDSPNAGGGNESERQSQWGQQSGPSSKKNRPEGSRGWGSSNDGDWKSKKNRPAKSPGMPIDDSSASGIFTATRQRLDIFTSEEQDILLDVEPIMQSIRRIMHQIGYTDGDRLSAEDQSYVLDNVFNYHPDKAVKMGTGIDYVMVSKHSSFQESRCFYIVSTDGHKEDFSYRKCLENFVRGKYPDIAESFVGKYFRKPRSGGNRERNPIPEETGSENRQ
ncbi:hypothetical protein L1049_010867 [Liquidambar formosana]|uniref:DNA-directed RNA polymerase subunit n=1 Tax=Liquidambar formosana TaxID=63359 RepID=A0AAP0RQQ0_LIQFO